MNIEDVAYELSNAVSGDLSYEERAMMIADALHEARGEGLGICECAEQVRELLAEREACATALDALYERGPGRGTAAWAQAWASGVLDAADVVRQHTRATPSAPPSPRGPDLGAPQ